MTPTPVVSVIMPVRNEAGFIVRSLEAVLNQDYPSAQLEILVVDGLSTDGTRELVQQRVKNFPDWVILLDNPAGIVPAALNIGLHHARGEVIVRVDGHCEIAPDYVSRCVELLQTTGADCVGGPIITVGTTWRARAIALAQSSFFGVGNAAFRIQPQKAGQVDTVAFGAYRRDVFARIGNFDPELVRNQDDEFNFRLVQAGGKIWLDPSIRSVYYSRASLVGLWQQYFQYGRYKVRVIQKRQAVPSWRLLVPGIFVLGLVGSLVLALFTRQRRWLLGVAGPYAIANNLASLRTAQQDIYTLPLLPSAFFTLHLSYGLGFVWGLWVYILGPVFFESKGRK